MVDTFTVFFFTQDGVTALMCAAGNGNCDVVTELISLGADVDVQTNVSYFLCFIMTLPSGSRLQNVMQVHTLLLAFVH